LTTSDEKSFEVSLDVIKQSITVNTLVTDLGMNEEGSNMSVPIPLPNVTADILELVIEWCEYHKNDAPVPEKPVEEENKFDDKKDTTIPEWDSKFLLKPHRAVLFHIAIAANYLAIKVLLDYCCKTIANMIKGKTPEQIRHVFGIECDFTPEELEAIKKDNA
ncbi:hypothetical protein PMAYCL1PPCAC_04638, partial [Pristionchus mayeri]